MLQDRKPKEMTDYDAAAALLMLSSGGRSSPQAESNNNHSKTMAVKKRLPSSPAKTSTPQSSATAAIAIDLTSSLVSKVSSHSKFSECEPAKATPPQSASELLAVDLTSSPESKVSSNSKLTRGGTTPPKLVPLRKEDLFRSKQRSLLRVQRIESREKIPQNAGAISKYVTGSTFSPSSECESTAVDLGVGRREGGRNSMLYDVTRYGSTSPPDLVHRWDSGRTSSPIVPSLSGLLPSPHSSHESYGELLGGPTAAIYDSPGMNGFALQLNSNGMIGRGKYAVSSPEPSPLVAPVMSEGKRKSRRSYHHHPPPCSAGSNVEEKSLNSPTDSGVSSIHDEILHPNLNVRLWTKGSQLGEGLPALVRTELRKIVEASSTKKERYTKTKMINFPLELSFHPNKSRFRKECSNDIDNLDREKNNEASRRSRHKKKLMTHMMNISLEYDRNENSQLYLQERWLNNMIVELEEKALNVGTEAQVLRKLRANCGFQ